MEMEERYYFMLWCTAIKVEWRYYFMAQERGQQQQQQQQQQYKFMYSQVL